MGLVDRLPLSVPRDARASDFAAGVRRVRYAGHEGGVPLRFHRWDRTVAFPQRMMVVHFSLVLTEETAGRPAWGRLVETMDREVRAAAIGLPERFRPPAEAGDASREGA